MPWAFLNCDDQPVDDALVPVVATEVVVAGGRLDLHDAVADLQQGHVERAAAEVEDEDPLLLVGLVQAVGQGGRGGLVDDARDVEARDLAGLLGGLALGVVEVRGDGDDRVGHRLAEVGLRVPLELAQHAGADLLGREALVVDRHLEGAVAHVALDRADGAVRVGDGLALGDLADEHLAVLGERDDRGGRARALGVRDHDGLAGLEDGDAGVGGTEVDADSTTHGGWFLSVRMPGGDAVGRVMTELSCPNLNFVSSFAHVNLSHADSSRSTQDASPRRPPQPHQHAHPSCAAAPPRRAWIHATLWAPAVQDRASGARRVPRSAPERRGETGRQTRPDCPPLGRIGYVTDR